MRKTKEQNTIKIDCNKIYTEQEILSLAREMYVNKDVKKYVELLNALRNYNVYLIARNTIQLLTKDKILNGDFFEEHDFKQVLFPSMEDNLIVLSIYLTYKDAEEIQKLNKLEDIATIIQIPFYGLMVDKIIEDEQLNGLFIGPGVSNLILDKDAMIDWRETVNIHYE